MICYLSGLLPQSIIPWELLPHSRRCGGYTTRKSLSTLDSFSSVISRAVLSECEVIRFAEGQKVPCAQACGVLDWDVMFDADSLKKYSRPYSDASAPSVAASSLALWRKPLLQQIDKHPDIRQKVSSIDPNIKYKGQARTEDLANDARGGA